MRLSLHRFAVAYIATVSALTASSQTVSADSQPSGKQHNCQYHPQLSNGPKPAEAKFLMYSQPPTDPNAVANADATTNGFTFSTATLDSFKKEVSAKATISFITTCNPPSWRDLSPPFGAWLKPNYSQYIFSTNETYDDQWKDGAPALSTVTQSYSGLLVSLSKLAYLPTTLIASEYHNNQQGIVLEQEYGVGLYGHKLWGTIVNPKDPKTTKSTASLIVSGSIRESFDKLSTEGDAASTGPGMYTQFSVAMTNKSTLAGSFKGFAPFSSPLVNGRASADLKYIYKLNAQWSLTEEVTDTYFATVPKNYRPNSFSSSIGLKYAPPSAK